MPSIDLAHRESGSLKLKFVMCKSSFVKDCIFLLKTTKELTLIVPEKCEWPYATEYRSGNFFTKFLSDLIKNN